THLAVIEKWKNLVLYIPVQKAIVHLSRFIFGKASLFRPCLNGGHLPRGKVGNTGIVYESFFDQILHCFNRFIKRDVSVPRMELVKVNPSSAQPFEPLFDGSANMVLW